MAFTVGMGTAKGTDAMKVGHEAAFIAKRRCGKTYPQLALLFASSRYNPISVLKGVQSVLGSIPLMGCTTAGEITSFGPDSRSVAVALIYADNLAFSFGWGENVSNNERDAGQRAARSAHVAFHDHPQHGSAERSAFIIFPDGLAGNGDDIIRGVQEVLGTGFPMIGGSAGDDFFFRQTNQFINSNVVSDTIPGILLGGNITVGIGIGHGWRPLGKPRIVTRAFANIIMEIDGRPAVSMYEDYFGTEAEELAKEPLAKLAVLYPLGMSIPNEEGFLVRNAIKVEQGGSLVCAGEVPEGSTIRLLMGSRESSLTAAENAAQSALTTLGYGKPRIALIFDSLSRHKLLGRDTKTELSIIKKTLGENVPVIGFYSYGEQAPLTTAQMTPQSYFHNGTIAILIIGE